MTRPRSGSGGRRPTTAKRSGAGRTNTGRTNTSRTNTARLGTRSTAPRKPARTTATTVANPWNALWAMMIGFFMILVDSTIVAVANPTLMDKLHTDWDGVIWVTSAYLLAYAVPLLVAGRLGDRFGPKNLYIIGLAIFTAASLWCGLAGSISMLIMARVVQGFGAALLTPQTLSTITRIFPADRRGAALSVWGATAGVATLVGPLAGGVLVDHLGWQWIFFVNVPIGVLGLALAVWLMPVLPTHEHRFDWLGVALSGIAMFLVVFGLQEGESHQWSWWIWVTIITGLACMAAFIYWQSVNKNEPLIPLRVFRDRNFTLSNIGVAVIGFTVTAMIVPVMFYAQGVCGLTSTESALLTAPMAIATGLLAPIVGKIVDRAHPTPVVGFGFAMLATALTWLAMEMTPTTAIWRLLLPFTFMGIGMAFIWAPLAATATRSLAPDLAGAGSGVYNATRQVGSVLGSAGVAAFMTSRIGAELPGAQDNRPSGPIGALPEFLREPFSSAMSQSLLLPAFIALVGVVAAIFMIDSLAESRSAAADSDSGDAVPSEPNRVGRVGSSAPGYARTAEPNDEWTEVLPVFSDDGVPEGVANEPSLDRPSRRIAGGTGLGRVQSNAHKSRRLTRARSEASFDTVDDDDDYVEFAVARESSTPPPGPHPAEIASNALDVIRALDRGLDSNYHYYGDHDERDHNDHHRDEQDHDEQDEAQTEPLPVRTGQPRPGRVDVWRSAPVSSWRSLFDEPEPAAQPPGSERGVFPRERGPASEPPESAYQRLTRNVDRISDSFLETFDSQRDQPYPGNRYRPERGRPSEPDPPRRSGRD